MGEKNTIALLSSINGYLKTMVDVSKQNTAQSPEDREKRSIKNNEQQVKNLSTGGLGGLKTEIKEDSKAGNLSLNTIISGVSSMKQLPVVVKLFANVKDKDIEKFEKCFKSLSVVLEEISNDKIVKGSQAFVQIAGSLSVLEKIKLKSIITNLLLFNALKVDKLLKKFTSGVVTAFKNVGKLTDNDIKKMNVAIDAMNSLNALAKGTMIVVGSVIALALAIKFIGIKEILVAGAAVLAILGVMTLVLKSVVNIASKMNDGVKKLDQLVNVVFKFQALVLTTLLVGLLAKKAWPAIAVGFAATAAVILGYALIITIGELVYGLFQKNRKSINGIFTIAAFSIALVLATVLVGAVVKEAWPMLIYGFGGVAATMLGYVLIVSMASMISKVSKNAVKDFYAIAAITAVSIGLVLATLLIGYVVKEAWDDIIYGFVGVAAIMVGYTLIVNLAAGLNKVGKQGIADLLGICVIAAAAELLVLSAAAIPYAMKRMGTTWLELIGSFTMITAMLVEIGGMMLFLSTIGNPAVIQQGIVSLGMIVGLISACELLIGGAILLGKAIKDDPEAAAIGVGTLALMSTMIKGLKKIMDIIKPIRAQLNTAYPTMIKVISLVYLCEGLVAASILIGKLAKSDPEAVAYGAGVLLIAGGIVKGVVELAKRIGKTNPKEIAQQKALKQIIILAYAAIGLVAAAILVGKLAKEEDSLVNAGVVLLFAGVIVNTLIKLMKKAADGGKKAKQGKKDLKQIIILAAAAEALVLEAILIAKFRKKQGISDQEVLNVLLFAGGIVTVMGILAGIAGSLDKIIKKGIKSLKQIEILAAGALLMYSAAMLIAKYKKENNISDGEILAVLTISISFVSLFGVLALIAAGIDTGGTLKKGISALGLITLLAAASLAIMTGVVLLLKYTIDNNITWKDISAMLLGMIGVVTIYGLLAVAAGAVFPTLVFGAVGLTFLCGVVLLTQAVMLGIIGLTTIISKLGTTPEQGFTLINKTLDSMICVVESFGVLSAVAGLVAPVLIAGAIGILAVGAAAKNISSALIMIATATKAAENLNDEKINKVITSFDTAANSIYDVVGLEFTGKAIVIAANLPQIGIISFAASVISKCMADMAGVVNDEGKMRSMTVTKDGKVVYGEWGDPIKAASTIATTMTTFTDILYASFSKMDETGLEMVSKGSETLSKVISPVSTFAKALMAFQEAGDGKIREIKFDDKGNQIDTPIVDVAAVAQSIANAVSIFCNTLFSENNVDMWARIAQGSVSWQSKDKDGKEESYTSEGSTKAAMGALGVVLDPICNFAKTLSMFENGASDEELCIPIYDQNGKLINRRIINVVNVATKIAGAVNSFIEKFIDGAKTWTDMFNTYKNDPAVKKQTDGVFSDETEYGDATNNMADSMGVFASVLSPIISFVNLIASFGDVDNGKLKVFDKEGKSRIIDPGVIATTIGNTITSFMDILTSKFKDEKFNLAFKIMTKESEGLKTIFTQFTESLTSLGEIDPEKTTKFYNSFNDILKVVLSFSSEENKTKAEGSINLLTTFENSIVKLCDDNIVKNLKSLNTSLETFKDYIGSAIVNALTKLNKVLNDAPAAYTAYATALDDAVNPKNKKTGIVVNQNKVATSINKTYIALRRLDNVLTIGSINRTRRFDEMTRAADKLNNSLSRSHENLTAVGNAIRAINNLCANASDDNINKALEAVSKISNSLNKNSNRYNNDYFGGYNNNIGGTNNNDSNETSSTSKDVIIDAINTVFDGATITIVNNNRSSGSYENNIIATFDVNGDEYRK